MESDSCAILRSIHASSRAFLVSLSGFSCTVFRAVAIVEYAILPTL